MINLMEMLNSTLAFLRFRMQGYMKKAANAQAANIRRFRAFERTNPGLEARSSAMQAAMAAFTAKFVPAVAEFVPALVVPKADRDGIADSLRGDDGVITRLQEMMGQDQLDGSVLELVQTIAVEGDARVSAYHAGAMRVAGRSHVVNCRTVMKYIEDTADIVLNTIDEIAGEFGEDQAEPLRERFRDEIREWCRMWNENAAGTDGKSAWDQDEHYGPVLESLNSLGEEFGLAPEKAVFVGAVIGPALMMPAPMRGPLVAVLLDNDCNMQKALRQLEDPAMLMQNFALAMLLPRLGDALDTDTEYWGDSENDVKLALQYKIKRGEEKMAKLDEALAEVAKNLAEAKQALEQAKADQDIARINDGEAKVAMWERKAQRGAELKTGLGESLQQARVELTEFDVEAEPAAKPE